MENGVNARAGSRRGGDRDYIQRRDKQGRWTSQKSARAFEAGVMRVMRAQNRPAKGDTLGTPAEMDFKFKSLNSQEIMDTEHYFESNPFVKAVANLSIQELLGGGIVFPSTSPIGLEQHLKAVWMRFARNLLRSLYVWGIAAVVVHPHDDMGGIPKVLDLGMCITKIYHDVFNDNQV